MALLVSFCNQTLTPSLSLLLLDENNSNAMWINLPSLPAGTGGCVGLEKGENKYYVLTQSASPEIFIYDDSFQFINRHALTNVIDAHSLVYLNNALYIVSTGDNSIYKVDLSEEGHPIGNEERFWSFPNIEYMKKDVVHLNCVDRIGSELIVTFFGKKKEETTWKTTKEGGCYNITKDKLIATNLYHPHTVKFINDRLFVCESNGQRLLYGLAETDFDLLAKPFALCGYLRGFCYGNGHYYVGRSEGRKVSRSRGTTNAEIFDERKILPAVIFQLDETLSKIEKEIDVSSLGPEIYDLIYIPDYTLKEGNAEGERIEELESRLAESSNISLQLQLEHQALQQEHQALQQEHQALQQEHQALVQSRAVQFAIELGRHPVLLKAGKFSYGVLAKAFKSFKGK